MGARLIVLPHPLVEVGLQFLDVAVELDTSRNPAASSAEVGLRLLLRREASEMRSPGEGATTAAWSLACRADRYAGAALPLSQTNRLML